MALYGFLIVAIIAGVLVFSFQRSQMRTETVTVTAWGTIPASIVNSVIRSINEAQRNTISLEYRQFSRNNFESQLVDALASGQGPDLVFMSNDLLVKHENKLYTVGYDFYPQRTFRDNFIEAGDVLTNKDGIVGFPYIIDPLVLYWNRSMLNSAGISEPPAFWDQLLNMTPRLTSIDSNLAVQKASIAMGEFRNIKNAKEIIVSLIIQSGSPVVSRNTSVHSSDRFVGQLAENFGFSTRPANAALNFYVQFSNPNLSSYSWNRSLPNSEEMFLSGDLAFYVGYASEFRELQQKNPNLNFDVAVIPQSRISVSESGTVGRRTLGNLSFIGIVNNSNNIPAAFEAVKILTSPENIKILNEFTNLPPVRRDLLSNPSENAILQTFFDSALIAKPFLDPEPTETNNIFSDMIESVTSGRSTVNEAVGRADNQINQLMR